MHAIVAVALVLAVLCALALSGCAPGSCSPGARQGGSSSPVPSPSAAASASFEQGPASALDEGGSYTSKEDVALYIHTFGHLPDNYVTKTKAKKAGWVPSRGNLGDVCPGKSIGGGVFYNDEGLLPDARGRTWRECDIDYAGGARNAKRIVYSDDGLVYYTGDHYRTFERLY